MCLMERFAPITGHELVRSIKQIDHQSIISFVKEITVVVETTVTQFSLQTDGFLFQKEGEVFSIEFANKVKVRTQAPFVDMIFGEVSGQPVFKILLRYHKF